MTAATPSAPTLRKPDLATDRPTAPRPIWHNIPAELQARRQWVCWRYEIKRAKWTKVPYNARTAAPASTTAPPTWSSFQDAKQACLDQPFYDGIGYVFSKNDPYCGVDLDHCINDAGEISTWAAEREAQLQASGAYTETSVSGSGVHAIVLATIGKGIKKPLGEIYDRGRFFTFSGNRRPGSTPIGDGQAVIDALAAELRGSTSGADDKPARDGKASDCNRAGLAASHPESEWEAARQLSRTQADLLDRRFLAATAKEETQGYFAARSLWAELHTRWPIIGLYRADGSLDDSQTRAAVARAIYGRGFTFPQFVVIMSRRFAAQVLAKWGTKQAWREELAALWQNAIDKTPYKPNAPAQARPAAAVAVPARVPRGRASNHAEQVERVYGLLLDHRAGAQALVQTGELASEAGMHRVTLAGILAELRSAGRISTERAGRYAGLIISFSDVAIVAAPAAAQPATDAQTAIEPAAPLEETRVPNSTCCVSYERAEAGYSSPQVEQAPDLAALAAEYLARPADEVGRRCKPNKQTGALVYRHDARHFAELVEPYGYSPQEARTAYKAEQQRLVELAKAEQAQRKAEQAQRKAAREAQQKAELKEFFAWLKSMSNAELVEYIGGGCKRELTELARNDQGGRFDRYKYKKRLDWAKQQLAWRGVKMPEKPVREKSAKPSKPSKPKRPVPLACQPLRFEQPPAVEQHQVDYAAIAAAMIPRLQAQAAQRQQGVA